MYRALAYCQMEIHNIKLVQTIIVVALLLISRLAVSRFFFRLSRYFETQRKRLDGLKKITYIILFAVAIVIVFIIWGVDQGELLLFISSFLTVLGVAFFAQWSLLSNITASIILFLNHPAKVGDTIQIFDKEFPFEGEIKEIGIFFILIDMGDNCQITIPSSLFLQKMVKIVEES
jgi:small-conductance mechanosensitive channel